MWPVHISALFVFHTALCSSEKLPFWFVILTSVIIRQNFFTSRFSRILTMYMSEDKEDAMDRCKWRKTIKDVRWSGWVWVGESFSWGSPGQKAVKRLCVCVSALSITAVRRSSIETSAERLQLTGSAAPSTGMPSRSYNGSQVACGPFEHSYLHHRLPAVPWRPPSRTRTQTGTSALIGF